MAWNEPGGGRDPWGGKNKGEGPPDLDEALRKFQERFGGLFGGGGKPPIVPSILVVLVLIIGFSFMRGDANWFFGIYQVEERNQAVVLRLGKYHETLGPGLRWNAPLIDQVIVENVTEVRHWNSRGPMLTQDENIVEVPINVQYNIKDVELFVLNVKNPDISLINASDSAIRHVVGSSSLNDVLGEGRVALATEVESRLQRYLDHYGTGISILQVNLLRAEPPEAVKPAFDDVIAAREDEVRFKNEAEAYSNQIIPEARGRAVRMIQEAEAYREQVVAEATGEAQRFDQLLVEYSISPEVTRERLYLDAIQKVLESSSKVLVDVEGGNNLMYLPLDKLTEQKAPVRAGQQSVTEGNVNEIADRILRQLQQGTSNAPRREVRR